MATSGSANIVYTGQQLVTEALRFIGVRATDTADGYTGQATIIAAAFRRLGIQSANITETYTAEATIVAAALRRIGIQDGNVTETYTAPATIIGMAQKEIGDHSPTAARTTIATNALAAMGDAWARHGLTMSGSNYADQWVDALVYNLAVRIAPTIGRPVKPELLQVAQQAFAECLRHPTADFDSNANQILTELADSWSQYGMALSSGNYPDRWVAALTNNLALRLAQETNRPIPDGLAELAQQSLQEAIRAPYQDLDQNASQLLTEIEDAWQQYGMTKSGGAYPDRWVGAFTSELALRLAYENNRPVPAGLPELAARTFLEARNYTKIDSGLNKLNMLLMNWNAMGIRMWAVKNKTISLTSGVSEYTIGESGKTVTMTIPQRFLNVTFRDPDNNETPIRIYTRTEWANVPSKTDTGDPVGVFYDPALNSETLVIWPVIDRSGCHLVTRYQARLEEFDAITDDVFCSPDWYRAIAMQLALDLAPEYDKQPSPLLAAQARDSFLMALGNSREIPAQPLFGWPA